MRKPLGLEIVSGGTPRLRGAVPLGFQQTAEGVETDPDGLETVRLILRRRRDGVSFRAIAAELTELGRRTKRGGEWYASTVAAVWKRRERYIGLIDEAVNLRLLRAGRDW